MDIPWGDIATFTTAALSAVAAVGAWRAAHRSADTADTVARIEENRWHADLLPQFDVSIEEVAGDQEGARSTLSVRLVGPLPLCHLDEIRIAVVTSDDMVRLHRFPGDPSQEDLDGQVWGPLRFARSADGADANGQTVDPFRLDVGQGRPFSLERTRPPSWQTGNDRDAHWRDQWVNTPLRIVLTCKRDGFKTWIVPRDVEVPEALRARWMG